MEKLIRLSMLIVVFLFSSQVYGQYLKLQGGVNLATQINKDNSETYSNNYANRTGFNAGFVGGIGLGPIGVESGLLVSTRGYNYNYTEEVNGEEWDYSGNNHLYYLDVPVMLRLKAAGFYLTAGPVLSYGLGGTYIDEITINDDVTKNDGKINWGDTVDDDLKRMDVGMGLGAGIQLGNISLSAGYNWGLVNLSPTGEDGEEIKNRLLQFSLGFKIL